MRADRARAACGTRPRGHQHFCSDGIHYGTGQELTLLTSPITVQVEYGVQTAQPGFAYVQVCFSDTPPGQPSRLTGGLLKVQIDTDTRTASPGAGVGVACVPDLGGPGVFPVCSEAVGVALAPGDVAISTPPSSICIVSLGAGCVAYVPGVKVRTGDDPRPLLALNLLGFPLIEDAPQQCLAVVVTCP